MEPMPCKLGRLKTRWLDESIAIQWDYKNIVKRRYRLEPLEGLK